MKSSVSGWKATNFTTMSLVRRKPKRVSWSRGRRTEGDELRIVLL